MGLVSALIFMLVLTANMGVKTAVMSRMRMPVTCVSTEEKKVALTFELTGNSEDDRLTELPESVRATFFAEEEFLLYHTEKVIQLSDAGNEIGLLENSFNGKTKNEINSLLADRIEELSEAFGIRCDTVRFADGRYDSESVGAVLDLGLFPVQWSADGTEKKIRQGDIIRVGNDTDVESLIKKLKNDGYEIVPVGELILKENYKIDLSGMQFKKYPLK